MSELLDVFLGSLETYEPFKCKSLRKAHDALSADRYYSGESDGGNGFTILGGETSSRRYFSFRDTRIDLRAYTHVYAHYVGFRWLLHGNFWSKTISRKR